MIKEYSRVTIKATGQAGEVVAVVESQNEPVYIVEQDMPVDGYYPRALFRESELEVMVNGRH